MTENWTDASYVLRSQYRLGVVRTLSQDGPLTPSALADETGFPQSHVSRAIAELRDRGVVELLVPEAQSQGRLYALTDGGHDVWRLAATQVDVPPWELRTDETRTDREREILARCRDEAGDALRTVGYFDGERSVFLYVRSDLRRRYSNRDIESRLAQFFSPDAPGPSFRESDVAPPDLVFAYHDGFALLRLFDTAFEEFALTFDAARSVRLPGFADRIRAVVAD